MARHPGEGSERESSADPLDLISPPRSPQLVAQPPQPKSNSTSASTSTSRKRNGRSTSSRSASPVKKGTSKSRAIKSKSTSPEKKVVRRVVHGSQSESKDLDEVTVEEERGNSKRQMKKRRIQSDSEEDKDGDMKSISAITGVNGEQRTEEVVRLAGQSDEPADDLLNHEEVKMEEELGDTKIGVAQDDEVTRPTSVQDGTVHEERSNAEVGSHQQEEQPEGSGTLQGDNMELDNKGNGEITSIEIEKVEPMPTPTPPDIDGTIETNLPAHPSTNTSPSATIGPIQAANPPIEEVPIAGTSEIQKEPKDLTQDDIEGMVKGDDFTATSDAAQANQPDLSSNRQIEVIVDTDGGLVTEKEGEAVAKKENLVEAEQVGNINSSTDRIGNGQATSDGGSEEVIAKSEHGVTEEREEHSAEEKMDIDSAKITEPVDSESAEKTNKVVEAEGEMEIDTTPYHDVEEQGEGENEIESSHNATPAPSSPAISITASQASTNVTKPNKKAPATSKKKSANTGGKKASTPMSGGSGVGSGIGKKGAGKGKGKTKVEELKGASSSKTKSSSSASSDSPQTPTTPTRPTSTSNNSPNPFQSPDKNAIYCVCRKPYNEEEDEVMMVGCESCDNWFHPNCVGLTDEMVDALDVYICKSCERSTHQRTIYKQLCKRDGCSKSLAGTSSKFCSSSCAFQHSQSLLSSMTNKNTLKQLAKTFIGFPEPKLGISTVNHAEHTPSLQCNLSNSDRLVDLEKQLDQVNRSIELVLKRQKILDDTIRKAESAILTVNVIEEEEEEVRQSKKGKKKKSGVNVNGNGNGSGKDDKPCGWNKILIAEDQEVRSFNISEQEQGIISEEEEGEICMRGKRRCDRHQGWQRTIAAQLEVEMANLERTHKNLAEYIDNLKSSSEVITFSDEIRNGFLERKGLLKS
ncbi:hypothetical protein L486_05062 [Kwoniella mangroviensis CBS 10435]|uniref:PHD-type domain-containing protein n=1 Tax=Kwoniella mangroviensis CBS 10435 TaxID=1331196 RepID=A0A1B9IPV7_9TREE|nr:hypothetical protein L486_05062 [Kwoniella mangroviensis CBS 10435]